MSIRNDFSRFVALATLAATFGCDPEGPGAAGNITLDSSVDASGFSVLELRVYPDPGGSVVPVPFPENGAQQQLRLKDIALPYHYDLGQVLGTTDEQHWRMAGWLSASTSSTRPATSDPQCSIAFDLQSCGAQFGGYCTTKDDVDCALK